LLILRTQKIGFQLKKHEVTQVWPEKLALVDFGRLHADNHIKSNIDNYFNQLQPHFDRLVDDLHGRVSTALNELRDFSNDMFEYNKSMQITGDFVR
jgi:hypothetical protein